MNRIIRFRVWNKTQNKWDDPSLLRVFDLSGQLCHLYGNGNEENWVIQQFTGFKDRKGKGIYEGDIIKFDKRPGFAGEPSEGLIREIMWNENDCCFNLHKFYFWSSILNKEVIGNIFENKELLK